MKIVVLSRILHDGKEYLPGDAPQDIKGLDKDQAQALFDAGAAKLPAAAAAPKPEED